MELNRNVAGNEGLPAVFSGLLRNIWIEGIYDIEVPNAVSATKLYPDLKFATVTDFYKGRV